MFSGRHGPQLRLNRDARLNNAKVINRIKIPVFPEPPSANGTGYIYYNSTDGKYYVSTGSGTGEWSAVIDGGL